jgi:hypothetical protein
MPVELAVSCKLSTNSYQEGMRYASTEYTSIELIDKLLSTNYISFKLEELQAKA